VNFKRSEEEAERAVNRGASRSKAERTDNRQPSTVNRPPITDQRPLPPPRGIPTSAYGNPPFASPPRTDMLIKGCHQHVRGLSGPEWHTRLTAKKLCTVCSPLSCYVLCILWEKDDFGPGLSPGPRSADRVMWVKFCRVRPCPGAAHLIEDDQCAH
jgi:hypothetical protein